MWGNDLPRFTECSSTCACIIVELDLTHLADFALSPS